MSSVHLKVMRLRYMYYIYCNCTSQNCIGFECRVIFLWLQGKEGILRLHPDLAGRLAQAGQLTSESTREQASAGLNTMTEEERQRMANLNKKYKHKFGFPFVICARENKKDAILRGLEERLENAPQTEAITGANEVKKICRLRLLDLVRPDSQLNSPL